MTNALAIDTTSEMLSLAVAREGQPVAHHYAQSGTRMAGEMFGVLDGLFEEAGLTLAEVEVIVVARGPGSFTGTRLGLAMARTFAQVQGCPLIGVDTLRLLAAQCQANPGEQVHAALNCIRDEVYHAAYVWEGEALREVRPVSVMAMADLATQAQDCPVVLRRFLAPRAGEPEFPEGLQPPTLRHPQPDGRLLLQEGLALFAASQTGQGQEPLPAAEPIYLKSEAFRKWKP